MRRIFTRFTSGAGFWALADQGVTSGGNFLTNILLARNLPPEEYGIFALVFGLMLVLNSLHAAVVTYPLSVRGASADESALREIVSGRIALTTLLMVPALAGFLIGGWLLGRFAVGLWAFLALLLWQVQETLRRGLMARFRFREAFAADCINYLGQACIAWWLVAGKPPSLSAVLAGIAATSLLSIVLELFQLRPELHLRHGLADLWRDSWDLGSWVLLTNGVVIFSTAQAFAWLLSFTEGPKAAANIQSLANVLGITHPILTSIGNLVVPAASRAHREIGLSGVWSATARYAKLGFYVLIPFFVVLLIAPGFALRLFYGKSSPYLAFAAELRFFVIIYLANYCAQVMGGMLRGIERSKADFKVNLATAILCAILGWPAVLYGGITGACVVLLGATVFRVVLLIAVSKSIYSLGSPAEANC